LDATIMVLPDRYRESSTEANRVAPACSGTRKKAVHYRPVMQV
jgi:hypothetical protein